MVIFSAIQNVLYNDFTRLLYVRLWLLAMTWFYWRRRTSTGRVEHFTGHGRGFTGGRKHFTVRM